MWVPAIVLLAVLPGQVLLHAEEITCPPSTIAIFVRDSLPTICFGGDSAGVLNYSMDSVDFYNAHCRLYQDVKHCLETKFNRCEENQPGFIRHALSLIESYQLPVEYFDHDAKTYDDNHFLHNLVPFCDGDKLLSKWNRMFSRGETLM